MNTTKEQQLLFMPDNIRKLCHLLLAQKDSLPYFIINEVNLTYTAQVIADECRKNYPCGDIPIHSRWRHFNYGNIDRIKVLKQRLQQLSLATERLDSLIDLTLVSVLLDAGAGHSWQYYEAEQECYWPRSQGLAIASLQMFNEGFFSHDPAGKPYQVSPQRLSQITLEELQKAFQVNKSNMIIGLNNRLKLLQTTGKILHHRRFAHIITSLMHDQSISARAILVAIITEFSLLWSDEKYPNLGDIGYHRCAKNATNPKGLIAFHKIAQWLTYSLIETLFQYNITVTDKEVLTGLPEYRNGGLLLETKVLALKDLQQAKIVHVPQSELIVEWRALTVALLDQLLPLVRKELKQPQLSLGSMLEGGSWAAGRRLAFTRSKKGIPPLMIANDGAIF